MASPHCIIFMTLGFLQSSYSDVYCGGAPCYLGPGVYGTYSDCSYCQTCPINSICSATAPSLGVTRVCAPGLYNGGGAGVCCPVGFWTPTSNMSEPGGSIHGSMQCNACPVGTSGTIGANTLEGCVECSVGTFNDLQGQPSCFACPPDTYMPSFGSTQCLTCPTDLFSMPGAGVCCSLGYWSACGSLDCNPCPVGTSSSTPGANTSTYCQSCPPGEFNPTPGQPLCTQCSPGRFNPSSGSTSEAYCEACPPNFYNPQVGSNSSSACIPCPSGSSSPAAASMCTPGGGGTSAASASSTSSVSPMTLGAIIAVTSLALGILLYHVAKKNVACSVTTTNGSSSSTQEGKLSEPLLEQSKEGGAVSAGASAVDKEPPIFLSQ